MFQRLIVQTPDITSHLIMGEAPVLAIEVGGVAFHGNELQREKDSKKNHILAVIGLPLLRLSTDGHHEETRIIESLALQWGYIEYLSITTFFRRSPNMTHITNYAVSSL